MKKTEFKKLCDVLTNKKTGFMSDSNIKKITPEQALEMVFHIVRERQAVWVSLIEHAEKADVSDYINGTLNAWLSCMGFSHTYINKAGFKLRGTIDHVIRGRGK